MFAGQRLKVGEQFWLNHSLAADPGIARIPQALHLAQKRVQIQSLELFSLLPQVAGASGEKTVRSNHWNAERYLQNRALKRKRNDALSLKKPRNNND
jgi:hypothetical protein